MGTQLSLPKRDTTPIFRPCLLRPNGWMDQDGIWYGGGSRSRPHCARWGPSYPAQKGDSVPIFGKRLLWPNGCMDQDATWYGGRHRPRRRVRWRPSSPKKGHSPLFRPCLLWPRSPISATAELLFMFLQACRFEQIKSSAVAEMGERSHNRYEPKRAGVLCHNAHSPEIGGLCPFRGGGAGSPYKTM